MNQSIMTKNGNEEAVQARDWFLNRYYKDGKMDCDKFLEDSKNQKPVTMEDLWKKYHKRKPIDKVGEGE